MKRGKVVRQGRRAAARPKPKARELDRAPFKPEGAFTFVTAAEAASYLRFDTAENPARAFMQWARRQRIPVGKVGRRSVWFVADLDDAVRGPRDTRKQIQAVQQHRRGA